MADDDELDRQVEALCSALAKVLSTVVQRLSQPSSSATAAEPWVTVEDAARHASVSTDIVRKWVHLGLIPAGRHGTRILRVRLSDIDNVLFNGSEPDPDPVLQEGIAHPRVAELLVGAEEGRKQNATTKG